APAPVGDEGDPMHPGRVSDLADDRLGVEVDDRDAIAARHVEPPSRGIDFESPEERETVGVGPITKSEPISIVKPEPPVAAGQGSGCPAQPTKPPGPPGRARRA